MCIFAITKLLNMKPDFLNKTPKQNECTFNKVFFAFKIAALIAVLFFCTSIGLFCRNCYLAKQNTLLIGKVKNDSISISSYKQNIIPNNGNN